MPCIYAVVAVSQARRRPHAIAMSIDALRLLSADNITVFSCLHIMILDTVCLLLYVTPPVPNPIRQTRPGP